ncbi:ABC transporter substrate-binding protein [Paracoccus aerius]|uniref:ABC transporter substrate-binding protein n=1 Tax=Paracoccus aerius TaxID=1915382 RepID=A0ABS1SAJ7_9RHOB|nr:ABC transporter substrate-binding protein [Paracoccus aerius]MBL3675768.1 ABC transporter substrate-binding protein [Paracoccus aerius]GHG37064.1 sulfonate ABC transporter substrate-binding protein [Paracoccus aerius]
MNKVKATFLSFVGGGLLFLGVPAFAQSDKVAISISYQPAIYGLGIEIATAKGWWEEAGLDPQFTMFPSGAPQIAAAAAGDWDVGLIGAPPAVLGASRIGLQTIGVATVEGNANVVLARPDQAEQIRDDPSLLKGKPFLLSTNSTAEYAAWGCLSKLGLQKGDMQFVNLSPSQIVSAFTNGEGTLAATFTPFAYTIEQHAGAVRLCSAADADLFLLSAIVVRPEYAEADKQAVAKFLATYLRAIQWIKNNQEEAQTMLKEFYAKNGVLIEDKYMLQEMSQDRQQYSLEQQLEAFSRASGPSTIDQAFDSFMDYLIETGTIQQKLEPESFISDEYLQMIEADPELKAWANNQ